MKNIQNRMKILFCLSMIVFSGVLHKPVFAQTLPDKEKSTVEIFRREGKSVVQIETDDALGSGVVISKSGIIVTNYHVIHGAKAALARTSNGRVFPLEGIIELDKDHDLALVKVKSTTPFTPIVIGNSGAVKVGDKVIAIGNPEGFQNTISEGIVSGFRMRFGNIYWGFKLIQISAPISPGSSGGALVDQKGELIGITSAGFIQEAENLNVAVPIDYIKPMLPAHGRIAFIQKFGKNKSFNETQRLSRQFLSTSFYLMERLLQAMSGVMDSEQKGMNNDNLKPDIGLYEIKTGLNELGALFNLGLPSASENTESQIRLDFADILIKLSESTEDFIQAFSQRKDFLANLEYARDSLKQVRSLVFQTALRLLSSRLSPDDQTRLVAVLKKYPPFFRGEVYYGIGSAALDKNKEVVLVVYPDSPAAKAGIKEGSILTSPLDYSQSAAYKKQIVSIVNEDKPQTLFVTPVRFGFDVKPVVVGLEAFQNESISSGAPLAVENLVMAALARIPNLYAMALPRNGSDTVVQEAAQNGLDYVLQGKVTRLEEDSLYSLFPSTFQGYDVKLGLQLTLFDPFGQATACCKSQQIEVHSPFANAPATFQRASDQLMQEFVKEMTSAGIIKPEPKKESRADEVQE